MWEFALLILLIAMIVACMIFEWLDEEWEDRDPVILKLKPIIKK